MITWNSKKFLTRNYLEVKYLCIFYGSSIIIVIIIFIIKNISPCKLIDELQMCLCSSHLSNKKVFSNFRNESKLKDGSFILAGRSFQIVEPQLYFEIILCQLLGCVC